MRDYGKVHTSYWTSSNIRSMSEDGRALAMYLLTCPHGTISGVFRLPDGYACEDLQWDAERVSKGFDELLRNGFANRCATTKWVWISKHFEWNPPENPNQRKAAAKVASQVPDECVWKPEFMRVCGKFFGVFIEEEINPSPTLPEPFLNQEQEQEQEKENTVCAASDSKSSAPAEPTPKKVQADRGTRLPADWVLPKRWGDWAADDLLLGAEFIRNEAAKFADFWHSKAGADARKTDWSATWRNWMREAKSRAKPAAIAASSGAAMFAGML